LCFEMTISLYFAGKVFCSMSAISRRTTARSTISSANPRAARAAVPSKFSSPGS
jgi:hypothetical protein